MNDPAASGRGTSLARAGKMDVSILRTETILAGIASYGQAAVEGFKTLFEQGEAHPQNRFL